MPIILKSGNYIVFSVLHVPGSGYVIGKSKLVMTLVIGGKYVNFHSVFYYQNIFLFNI